MKKQDPKVDRCAASDAGGVAFRRATSADADAVADVFRASFQHAHPDWPPVHTDDEVRGWIAGHLIPELETWLAMEADGSIVGFMALDGGDLDQLYLRPDRLGRGQGVGTAFCGHGATSGHLISPCETSGVACRRVTSLPPTGFPAHGERPSKSMRECPDIAGADSLAHSNRGDG